MPRAITALLVHIGPLGAALEAAFPFAAIALGAVLLIEHFAKLREAGVKLTEDQTRFETTVHTAFNALDQRLLQAGIKSDELRNDHLGALPLQLELIDKASMAELVQSFAEVAKGADIVFSELKKGWYQFGIGSGGAKHALDEFQSKYELLLKSGKDKEASDLLRGTRESAERVLQAQQQIKAANAETDKRGLSVGTQSQDIEAANALKKAGVGYTDDEVKSQQTLVDALNAQLHIEGQVAALKKQDSGNASATTGKELAALAAEGARSAAEHRAKMAEIALSGEKALSEAELAMKESTIAERLAVDKRLADEEYRIQTTGNKQLIDALDRGGKDYNNQLKALHQKAEELTAQHTVTIGNLEAKAREAQYRLDLTNLTTAEQEKIEATDQGSRGRLAAIDAALKEEQSKNLQNTAFYRDLLKQRVEVQRQADAESAKLAAEAGKEEAENALKMGELALASQREIAELSNALGRVSWQQRMDQDVAFAHAERDLKLAAMEQEAAALDKGAKDYQNKLSEIQNKEKQLEQQHANDVASIRAKAQAKELTDQRTAMASMENTFASGFMQVLAGHQSFTAMMEHASQQLSSNLVQAAIQSAQHLNDDKLDQAKAAARAGFTWGSKYGGPLAPVLAPTMAATFFAGVMAFERGGVVPGIGGGDVVPAMLTPGEGIIPGSVMAGLQAMARSGNMGGGGTHTTVHIHSRPNIQAIDGSGMERVLAKHSDTIAKHVGSELRKLNR